MALIWTLTLTLHSLACMATESNAFSTDNGAIFFMDPSQGPTGGAAVLLAQLTIQTDSYAAGGSASASLQGRSAQDGADDWDLAIDWHW